MLVPPELKLLEDLPPGVKIDVSKLQLEPEDDSDLSAFLIDPRQGKSATGAPPNIRHMLC